MHGTCTKIIGEKTNLKPYPANVENMVSSE